MIIVGVSSGHRDTVFISAALGLVTSHVEGAQAEL